ncbi:flavo protein [Tothia fuscella]|uniref:Flavo protein n=1 Tax=Tothia fuscella TaxID=1048955 RepID=A0A9P4NTE5_9PEZI|nr:flavo protein [Tothia fuscella]
MPLEVFDSSLHLQDNKFHVLLAASGSVATIKIPNIIDSLGANPQISIRLILTASAAKFLNGQSEEQPSLDVIRNMRGVEAIYLDEDEWVIPWTRGAKILHIEMRRWANIMVVAPLSANTMAKMAAGLCDNLLLSTMRAWDVSGLLDPPHEVLVEGKDGSEAQRIIFPTTRKKIIVVAVAMNTAMWFHPITQKHMKILEEDWGIKNGGGWIEVLRPIDKGLACGDVGSGAMENWTNIVARVNERLFGG